MNILKSSSAIRQAYSGLWQCPSPSPHEQLNQTQTCQSQAASTPDISSRCDLSHSKTSNTSGEPEETDLDGGAEWSQFACRVFDPHRVLGFACGAGHLDVAHAQLAAVDAPEAVRVSQFGAIQRSTLDVTARPGRLSMQAEPVGGVIRVSPQVRHVCVCGAFGRIGSAACRPGGPRA
jgi:hypothetical protein